jgi:predicted transcriptional regulator
MLLDDVQELDEAQKERARVILEKIEENPDVNQATLADRLDVAVGTVNWHIKRMVEKGYIKLKRAERKKLKYIITPEGLAFRAHLTVRYIENSMMLYRRTRSKVVEILAEVRAAGYESIRVTGEGDLAEVIHLTCLEQGVTLGEDADLPAIEIHGWKVDLNMDGSA